MAKFESLVIYLKYRKDLLRFLIDKKMFLLYWEYEASYLWKSWLIKSIRINSLSF